MNIVSLSGRIVKNAFLHNGSKTKVLKFTIATKYGHDSEKKKDRMSFVPCVLFNPSEAIENLFAKEGKGVFIELQGRISSSSFEKNGKKQWSTEVIVSRKTLNIIRA